MSRSRKVLLVEDDLNLAEATARYLTDCGYDVNIATRGEEAISRLAAGRFDVVLTDLMLPGDTDGFEVMKAVKDKYPGIPCVVLSAYATVETAIEALRLGARDYLIKPVNMSVLKERLRTLLANAANSRTAQQPDADKGVHEKLERDTLDLPVNGEQNSLVFVSAALRKVKEMIRYAGSTDAPVLIEGESGVGKDLVAKLIHRLSKRGPNEFVMINCAAVPDQLLESELFGYEKGAFTGATEAKKGKLELAHKGTVYLNEIGDMPINLQAKLLQFCQDGTFYHLGGRSEVKVDVRIIAATNADLSQLLERNMFRRDLYYRLNVVNIHIPPLRDRLEDCAILAQYFLRRFKALYCKSTVGISPHTMKLFSEYPWPGNVRELENLIHRMVIFDSERVAADYMNHARKGSGDLLSSGESRESVSLKDVARAAAAKAERQLIMDVLLRTKGNKRRAARILGISYRALLYKTKEWRGLGLKGMSFQRRPTRHAPPEANSGHL